MTLRHRLAAVLLFGVAFLAAGAPALEREGPPESGGPAAIGPAGRSPRLAQLRAWVIEKTPLAASALVEALRDADPIDSNFTRELTAAQNFFYRGSRGQHPNDQGWPSRGPGGRWVIPTGMLDAAAPPVHQTITDGIVSDYPGRFDMPVPAGVAMWKANFEYHYQHPQRPILCVNAFHDWGLRDIVDPLGRPAHATEGRILKQFLLDVLVAGKDKFPDTHCVTFSQVLEYAANGGDLRKALAIGNGQDRRNPAKPSFDAPAGR